jgi:histone-lysine N-methyltransferase SETMAR
MDSIIAAPASCEVRAVIHFIHAEGQSAAEFMAPGMTIMLEVYCEMLNKLQSLIQNKERGVLTKVVILLHDNARSHSAARTNALIKLFNWEIFSHPPYSLDLAPSDYNPFIQMKIWLATQRFHTNEELMDGVSNWRHNMTALFFDEGLQKLVSWYDK